VLLNNKIPFVLHESSDSENAIYCKSFSDYLFNVGTFTTRTKEVILEYVVDNAEKYVVADVTFDNGECYRNVRFKVVVNENTETPYSTINLNLLNNKTRVAVPQKSQQIIEDVEEVVEEPALVYISAPIIEAPDYTETINETLRLQKKLNVEKEEIKKQKILLEKQDTIKRKLSEYKQELLEDYFNATKKQTELLENNIQENITTAEYELNQRITNTFNDFNLQLEEFKDRTKQEQIQLIVKQLGETAASIKLEITDIISSKFNSEHEQVVDLLYEKTKLLEETYQRKLIFELEQYKEKLFEEYRVFSSDTVEQVLKAKTDVTYQSIDEIFHNRQAEIKEYYDNRLIESRQEIDNFAAEIKTFSTHLIELEKAFLESEEKFKNTLTEKEKIFAESLEQKIANSKAEFGSIIAEFTKRLPGITSNINTLETKVKTLIEEKAKSFKEDFSTTQQDYIAKTAQYWAKRILDLGGGGGSVATQYANGGTMNGDLNVNANYLSGGVNLLDIFVTSDSDSQTLSFNESNAQLSISNGNTVSLSALSGEFTDRLVRGSYQVVLSGDGNLTVPGAIVTTSNSKLDLVGFGPNTAYLTSTNDDSTALFMGLASAELYAQTYVQIRANTGGISQNWTFGADGSLTFPDNTTQTTAFTGNPDSSNWDSNYTTVSQNSAYWADTRNNVTFEKNVTIQGNLTALGTSTFQNTVFTTTSALSVVNLGPGPALYVFQAAGPYDVASFYDGDGIEVLHVGNAQGGGNPLGQVGINTSFPSAELTVNGAISSNGVITVLGGNSNKWNSNWTTTNTNSASWSNWSSVSASYALGSQYVKLSGDTMTGTLSVGSGGNLFSPNFATFVKNSAYPTLSSTLINNSGYFDSRGTFASPGGFIIKGHAVDYNNSPRNLPNIGTYGLYIQNVNAFDPGTTFVSDGRAQVTHAMAFRAGINNFTGGSDHNHVQWQGSPSNSTQTWQMTNGGNATNVYGYQFPYTNRFMVHTLPQYQYNTTITAISGFIDTREANRVTGTDGVSGVKLLVSRDVGTGNYNLLNVGEVVGLTINPGLVGLVAATYNCQVTQISANAALSSFQFTAYIGNGDNWQPAQKNIQTVSLLSRTDGGNPGVSLVTSQIGTDPGSQYVGLTGSYRGINKHMLARFTSSALLTGYKTGAPLTLWIPPLMPSSSPIGTGIISSDKITTFEQGTFPTGVRSGYFDAYVINVSGADLEFALCNLMDSYSFENRSWPFSASGLAGWLLYGGSQDTVHRPTFGTTGFYFEREPWNVGSVNWLSGGMVKNVVLGTSESYGNFSYGLGWRGVVLGDKSGTFAGDYNTVFGNNSVALGGEGLISLSSTSHQAVVGKYNNPNNNALFVVGAGTNNTNRTNVLEVEASKVTINGAISSNGVITVLDGNSNKWNSNWTTTNTNSASWSQAYTNLVSNSSNYLSGASVSYVNTNFVKLSGDTMTGSLTVTGNISASAIGYFNHVAAATKSFYIHHPTKPGMHLQYGSLESPYHGVRLTGSGSVKSGDSVVVPLPDYIFSLVHQEGVNIQLTNYQHNKTLFVDDIDVSNNTFTVKCEKKLFDKGEYKFFWSFTAIRKDIPNLQVEM
jgi:hypothetical protein